ncbi:MAG: YraN family protein [Ilumatobacteraceae bacterium]
MRDQSNRARGQWGENRAAHHLRRAGYIIIERNWRSTDRHVRGEIDIIARDGVVVVFCEVKARRSADYGGAACAVDGGKQDQIRRLADSWMRSADVSFDGIRFDVVAIDGVRLTHYEAAF